MSSSSNDKAKQNAMPPRKPPKAIINWSIRDSFTKRRRFKSHANIVTPENQIYTCVLQKVEKCISR